MASDVSIANIALTILSTSRIISLTQDDENARKINAVFQSTRDALLEEHNWNFARTQATLSLLSVSPTLGNYDNAFQLPSDRIKIIRMELDTNFAIFGDQLFTNASEVKIEYIKQVTDPQAFSPLFVHALGARLAALLAYGVTQSTTVVQQAAAEAKRSLEEAKWADSQEGVGIQPLYGANIAARG